jgi:hypothetical protein
MLPPQSVGLYFCASNASKLGTRTAAPARADSSHTSAYVSIRQHTSAHATPTYLSYLNGSISTSRFIAYVSIRQHSSAYVSVCYTHILVVPERQHQHEQIHPREDSAHREHVQLVCNQTLASLPSRYNNNLRQYLYFCTQRARSARMQSDSR